MRRLAALLICVPIAFGQRSLSESTAALAPWVIDAVALDATGRPVTDLTADDFEVVHGSRRRLLTSHGSIRGCMPRFRGPARRRNSRRWISCLMRSGAIWL